MLTSLSLFFFALATILFLGALAAGWVAGTQPVSLRKGRAKFWSYACVGLAFIALAIPLLLQQSGKHPIPFEGTILAAQQSGGKSSHATLHVQLKNGCPLILHAGQTSPYFHPGQAIRGRYAPGDGTLLTAQFLGKDGKPLGDFHSRILPLLPYGMFLLGAFFVAGGWLLYRRDPLGFHNDRAKS